MLRLGNRFQTAPHSLHGQYNGPVLTPANWLITRLGFLHSIPFCSAEGCGIFAPSREDLAALGRRVTRLDGHILLRWAGSDHAIRACLIAEQLIDQTLLKVDALFYISLAESFVCRWHGRHH